MSPGLESSQHMETNPKEVNPSTLQNNYQNNPHGNHHEWLPDCMEHVHSPTSVPFVFGKQDMFHLEILNHLLVIVLRATHPTKEGLGAGSGFAGHWRGTENTDGFGVRTFHSSNAKLNSVKCWKDQ